MFTKLTDFRHTRTPKEAIGFYIAYFIIIIVTAMIAGAIVGVGNNIELAAKVGMAIAIIACMFLSYMIVQKKNLMNNMMYVV